MKSEIEAYVLHRQTEGANVLSIKAYRSQLRIFERYLTLTNTGGLHTLTRSMIEDFLYAMATNLNPQGAYTSERIRRTFFTVRCFFTYLEKTNQIIRNPAVGVQPPKPHKLLRDNYFTLDEMQDFFRRLPNETEKEKRNRMLFLLSYCAGLRLNEACNVKKTDINFESNTLYVAEAKGSSGGGVPLCRHITCDLREYLECAVNKDYLFTVRGNAPISRDAAMDAFNISVKTLGFTRYLTFHSLRKSIGRHLLESGLSVRYVQRFLRHKNINSTELYTHAGMRQLQSMVMRFHPGEQNEAVY